MAARIKPKPVPSKDHRVMLRLTRGQYEKLAHAAEVAAVPLAAFCRALIVDAVQQNRLRGITSKRSPAGKAVAA